MTTESADIESRVLAVSIRVSPLETLLVDIDTFTTSADSHFPAISKDVRVRVEASKNRLIMVFPRSVGTFLMGRDDSSCMDSAVSRISRISSRSSSRIPSRSFRFTLFPSHILRLRRRFPSIALQRLRCLWLESCGRQNLLRWAVPDGLDPRIPPAVSFASFHNR